MRSRIGCSTMNRMTRTQAYLYLVVVGVLIVGLPSAYSEFMRERAQVAAKGEAIAKHTPIPQPAYTLAVQAQLATSKGFQDLVSYTDSGFQPTDLTIAKNDTIRFTNNSHSDLWVAAAGATRYPSKDTSCAGSDFDSCHVIHSGEFWEFTFDVVGTWSFINNIQKTDTGTVHVHK